MTVRSLQKRTHLAIPTPDVGLCGSEDSVSRQHGVFSPVKCLLLVQVLSQVHYMDLDMQTLKC